jgi:hypothetical protein
MKLKNRNESPPEVGWVFHFENLDGRVQRVAPANSIKDLATKARKMMLNHRVPIPANLEEIIEHQICARMSNPTEHCWSGGLGDDIHFKWVRPFLSSAQLKLEASVDGRLSTGEKTFIKRFAKAAADVAVKVIKKARSCGACGGTKVYRHGDAHGNLGRAGMLNQMKGPK